MRKNIVTFVRSERRDLFRKEVEHGAPDNATSWSNIAGLIPDLERSTEDVRLRARKLHVHMWGSIQRFVGRPGENKRGEVGGGFGAIGSLINSVKGSMQTLEQEKNALSNEIGYLPFYLAQGRSPLRPPVKYKMGSENGYEPDMLSS